MSPKITMDILKRRSSSAQCGVMEREVIVKSENLKKAISTIKKNNYQFIGSGPGPRPGTKKVWYIIQGGF